MNQRILRANGGPAAKWPAVLIPILLFVLFDAVALALNVWISAELEQSAVAINLSGRQRMLSQRMTKALLVLQSANVDFEKSNAFEEFVAAVELFDKTLSGFLHGGMTFGGDGHPLYLPSTQSEDSRVIAASAEQLWLIVRQGLQPVLAEGSEVSGEILNPALRLLLNHNRQLLGLMNDLTTTLERNAAQEVFYLRTLQVGVLLLALFNFALVCKRLFRQIRRSQNNVQALHNIIDSMDTGVVLSDGEGVIISSNRAAAELFGYAENTLVGRAIKQLLFVDNDRTVGVRRDNSHFVAKVNTQTLFEMNTPINLCTIVDVSEQALKEQELMRLAFHDPLTGLPNRLLLMERLRQDLLRAKRDSTLLAVLFVDLDGFKPVNDAMGHDAGDQLLQMVARRLQQCCREVDTVARTGGDEFVFVITALHSISAAKQVGRNLLKAVNDAFLIDYQTVKISASVGIAMYPNDHSEAELLIKYADDAMYQAKQRGKNQLVFAAELR